MKRRPWTESELSVLQRDYGQHSAAVIAHSLGRTEKQVYEKAFNLGLSKPQHSDSILDRIRCLHGEGLTDSAIGRQLGWTREKVRWLRRHRLGLPANENAVREVQRQNAFKVCRRLGVKPGGQLRSLAFRRRAAAAGWPEDLAPREVEILELLIARGPMTRREICAELKLPWRGSRKSLNSRGRGSHLANLAARSLVVRVERARTVIRQGRGRSVDLYLVPLWVLKAWPFTQEVKQSV